MICPATLATILPQTLTVATIPVMFTSPAAHTAVAYVPFLRPLPIWDYWYLLLFPLCAGVAIVYKSIKCRHMSQVPWEASVIAVWIILGMAGAGLALAIIVKLMAA